MKDGHQIFSIAARSHDLNPMENIFHILQKKLQLVALEMKIERKDFEKSSAQVKKKKKNTGEYTSWCYGQNYSIDW